MMILSDGVCCCCLVEEREKRGSQWEAGSDSGYMLTCLLFILLCIYTNLYIPLFFLEGAGRLTFIPTCLLLFLKLEWY